MLSELHKLSKLICQKEKKKVVISNHDFFFFTVCNYIKCN